jgi:hypothetical protein
MQPSVQPQQQPSRRPLRRHKLPLVVLQALRLPAPLVVLRLSRQQG